MRTRIISMAIVLLCTTTLILAQKPTGEDLFQRGLDQERGKRDIPAAIKIYEDILKQFPSNRVLMAKTLAQLGECYEKLGQSRAQEYYEQVVAKYPEQADMVAKAKTRLASLSGVPTGPVPSTRFEFGLPQGTSLAHGFLPGLDISADGKRIAFVANPNAGGWDAYQNRRIYVKSTDDFNRTVPVPGAETGFSPFFSPDGQWLGFFASTPQQPIQLKKAPLAGGAPVLLARLGVGAGPVGANPDRDHIGATWGAGGRIVLGSYADGLKWVPESGGEPQPLTQLDRAAGEVSHRLPHFLPDGSGVLFTVLRGNPSFIVDPQIWVLPKTGKPKLVLENAIDARVAGNRLIFARDGRLLSVAFDARTLSVSGAAAPAVDDGVVHASRSGRAGANTGAAQYSVAQNGSLVYASGSTEPDESRAVVWVDETGAVTPIGGIPPRHYIYARVSPDGRSIALAARDGLWLYDVALDALESLPGTANLITPAEWSPDGTQLAFSTVERSFPVYVKPLASPAIRRIVLEHVFRTWTPEGRLWVRPSNAVESGIHVIAPDRPGQIQPLLPGSNENYTYAAFSPDGKWLAYVSNESGGPEIYVQPYPGPGPRVRVSADTIDVNGQIRSSRGNASAPAWSRDGQRLFFSQGVGIVSVRLRIQDGQFVPETPVGLFRSPETLNTATWRSWDVAPEGRFVMIQREPQANQLERERRTFPSALVLMAPATERITLGSGSGTPIPVSDRLSAPTRPTRLMWGGLSGALEPATPPGEYFMPELSADGKWLAFTRGNPRKVWRIELATGRDEPVTDGPGDDSHPRWSPDGAMIAFSSSRGGVTRLYTRAVGGAGNETLVVNDAATASDWSPDGKYLIYVSSGDVFAVPAASRPGELLRITATPHAESDARVSPGGRWIAYVSNETGRNEIYVESFLERGAKVPVSTGGGIQPRWAGPNQLFYFEPTTPGGQGFAVSVAAAAGSRPEIGPPQPMGWGGNSGYSGMMEREYNYNVAPDGRWLTQCGTRACLDR